MLLLLLLLLPLPLLLLRLPLRLLLLLRVPKAPYIRRPCGGRKGGGYLCCSCLCCL